MQHTAPLAAKIKKEVMGTGTVIFLSNEHDGDTIEPGRMPSMHIENILLRHAYMD